MKTVYLRKNEYRDSLFLMRLSNEVSNWQGVQQAVIVMGTQTNKSILQEVGLLEGEAKDASPDDLVVAIEMDTTISEADLVSRLDKQFESGKSLPHTKEGYRNLEEALKSKLDAKLVVISIAGEYAFDVAKKALENRRHVFCFSHHISIDDEISLKKLALQKGVLMMGPDCGTAILDGIGIGFANKVRRGRIGLISSSGSGAQEVSVLINNSGGGISQVIGVGGRDMDTPVDGLMTEAALRMLSQSNEIDVVVILTKKASFEAQVKILSMLQEINIPAVVNFSLDTGRLPQFKGRIEFATTYEETAQKAISLINLPWNLPPIQGISNIQLIKNLKKINRGRKYVRGLFAGGSLCNEAVNILTSQGLKVHSNLSGQLGSQIKGHVLLDLGAEEYTQGLPHPFIDPRIREIEIEKAIEDNSIGVILLDVVLGYGCHPDPAGEIVRTLQKAQKKHGENLRPVFIAYVCGTPEDPQNFALQREKLISAGVLITESNASAARLTADIVSNLERRA